MQDKIMREEIEAYMSDAYQNKFQFDIYNQLGSTNTTAKELAEEGREEGFVVIAEEQTAGRGRQGRKFFSPSQSGVYMSVILRPNDRELSPAHFTTMTAVAVSEAIEELSGKKMDVKWVNDIYFEEKKICGILTEGAIDMEHGGLSYVVIGIGINVQAPTEGYPEELEEIVTSISSDNHSLFINRNQLIAKVLEHMWEYYKKFPEVHFYEGYKERSFLIGRNVNVLDKSKELPAKVLDISPQFELIVQFENGEIKHLNSGEVRILWR